jgi:hypothetical protein
VLETSPLYLPHLGTGRPVHDLDKESDTADDLEDACEAATLKDTKYDRISYSD